MGVGAHNHEANDEIFGSEFDRLVIEFERMDDTFDDLVDKLEDIAADHGGTLDDDDRTGRVTYQRAGIRLTFDVTRRRLDVTLGTTSTLALIEAAAGLALPKSPRLAR